MLSNTAVPKYYGEFRDKVLRGEIPVNKEISMQMNRIDADIANPNYYYDDAAIDGYISFCENEMTLTDGTDLKLLPSFKLWAEDLLAWYEFIDMKVYNPYSGKYEIVRKKKRLRQKQYLIVARGNSKTLYQSTIQFYGLLCDTSSTHQVTVAPTMAQSEEVMDPLITAISKARGPLLKVLTNGTNKSRMTYSQAKVASTKKGIENKLTNSIIEIRPMSVHKLQGLRNKYSTVDEWLSGDVKEDVVEALEQGAAKGGIDDYIIVAVSSEGTVRDSVGDTIKMNLQKTLAGDVNDPHTSIFYYRLDDVKEVAYPDMWMKASPNIGITVSYETYQKDVMKAENFPDKRNDILAKRFGIPVEGHTRFFTYEETELFPPQDFRGLPCAMGMDASQGDDFWAFTFIIPLSRGMFGIVTRSYVSEVKYRKVPKATAMKYDEFINEGSLVVCKGTHLDWEYIYEDMDNFIYQNGFEILAFGYDPYNAQSFVERWITENGEIGVIKVRQGSMTESVPLGEIKNMANARELVFYQKLMKFAMGNSIVLEDNNGNYKLAKIRSDEKIDNVAALMDGWVAYKMFKEAFN